MSAGRDHLRDRAAIHACWFAPIRVEAEPGHFAPDDVLDLEAAAGLLRQPAFMNRVHGL